MSWDALLEASQCDSAQAAAKRLLAGLGIEFASANWNSETGVLEIILPGKIRDMAISGTISLAPAAAKAPRACPECHFTVGHWSRCVTKGYSAVGPHPNAPPPEQTARPAEPELCCGGTCLRSECEYHRASAAKAEYWRVEFYSILVQNWLPLTADFASLQAANAELDRVSKHDPTTYFRRVQVA